MSRRKQNCMLGFVVIIFSFLTSMGKTNKFNSEQTSGVQIPTAQLFALLKAITPNESNNSNFHVWYSEHFNDSTGIVQIILNNKLPDQKLGLCDILKHESNNIFIYDSDCQLAIPDSLLAKSDPAPFYTLHSPTWVILVKRRKDMFQFYRLSVISY